MNQCYLGLGSNQKSPERQIRLAIQSLSTLPKTHISKLSKLYKTKAWGNTAQQDFCNAVVEIYTSLPPARLLAHCQNIEKLHGRVRKKRWGPRTLDIDILLYGERIVSTKNLIIPHPMMHLREFVLQPLAQIK